SAVPRPARRATRLARRAVRLGRDGGAVQGRPVSSGPLFHLRNDRVGIRSRRLARNRPALGLLLVLGVILRRRVDPGTGADVGAPGPTFPRCRARSGALFGPGSEGATVAGEGTGGED